MEFLSERGRLPTMSLGVGCQERSLFAIIQLIPGQIIVVTICYGFFRMIGKRIRVPIGVCDYSRTKFWEWKFCGDRKIGLLESWRRAIENRLSTTRM